MKNVFKTMAFTLLGLVLSVNLMADSYTITFAKNTGDGTSASTSTACSTIVSAGSDYLSGNLATATKVYYSGGSGLKLGAKSDAGTIKMNLSTAGQVTPTSIVVNAKLYNSGKDATLKVNGSATQNLTADFADYPFTITSKITYIELVTSKYAWISSITVNYGSDKPYTVTFDAGSNGTLSCPSCTNDGKLTEASAGAGVTLPGVTADEGWKFLGWATTSGATTPGTNMTAGQTYKPSKDETLYAVYIQQFDVKWYVNGDLKKTDTYDKGANLHLPEGVSPNSSDCDGSKKFVGWSANEILVATDTKPTDLFSTASGTVTVPAKYYAVFAGEGQGPVEMVLNSSVSAIGSGYSSSNFTIDGVTFSRSDFGIQGTLLQWKGGTSKHFTSQLFPGAITKIQSSKAGTGSVNVFASTSSTFSGTKNGTISTSTGVDISFSKDDAIKYVKFINATSSYATASSITITYIGKTNIGYLTTCAPTYAITPSVMGNGSILWSTDGETFGETIANQPEGADVFFKLQPASGYEVDNAPTSSDVEITDFKDGIFGFTMPSKPVTISASFKQPAKYIIDYDLGNFTSAVGTLPEITEVAPGTNYTIDTEKKLTLTGYTFKGWNTNKDASEGLMNITVNNDITLYAIFTINSYNVIFTPSITGGSIKVNSSSTSPVQVQYNSEVTITVTPTSKYFKLTTLTYNSTDIKDTKQFTMPAENVEIAYSFTEDPKVTVTFKNNGETLATGGTREVYVNDPIGTLPVLTTSDAKDARSKTFVGWTESEINVWQDAAPTLITASEVIDEAKTYHAVWAKGGNVYYLIGDDEELTSTNYIIDGYDSQYGDYVMNNTFNTSTQLQSTKLGTDDFDSDENIINPAANTIWTINVLNKTNKEISIQNVANGKYIFFEKNSNDNYYHLAFSDSEVALTYNTISHGTNNAVSWKFFCKNPSSQRIRCYYNYSAGIKDVVYRAYDSDDNSDYDIYLYKQDISDYITHSSSSPLASIELNITGVKTNYFVGETFTSANLSATAKLEDNIEFPIELKDLKITEPSLTSAGEKTVTVKYTFNNQEQQAEYKVNAYSVTINLVNTDRVGDESVAGNTYDWNEQTHALTFTTRDHYQFNGITELSGAEQGGTKPNYTLSNPTANVTLTATWQRLFTLTYNGKGGSTPTAVEDKTKGTEITLATPSWTGYDFVGWYDNESYEGDALTSPYTITADAEIFAKWSEIMPASISLSPDVTEITDLIYDDSNKNTKKITATVNPSTALTKTFTWSVVEGADVVSVSSEGLITALKAGSAKVKVASTRVPTIYKEISVTVHSLPQITWKNMDGTTYASTKGTSAGKVGTMPSGTPTSCDATTYPYFRGWSATPFGKTTTNPESGFVTVNTAVELDEEYAFYAVCAAGINNAEEYSFTIQTSDFNGTSYAANDGNHDFTATCTTDATKTMAVACTTFDIMQSSSVMQWRKNTGYVFNTTDLGTIKSVTVNSSAGSFSKYYGTSQHPTSGTTVGNGYFTVSVGNATGKTSSIVVTFETGSISYTTWATQCCTTPTHPLEITYPSLTVKMGETLPLSIEGTGNENPNIVWASLNGAVATVSGGIVTPVSTGKATITVSQAAIGDFCEQYAEVEIEVIAANEFEISFTDVEGGSAVSKVNDTPTKKATTGTTVTITATPDDDYNFTGWTVNAGGVTLADASLATTTFVMGEADVEITPSFALKQFTVTLNAGTGTVETASYTEDVHTMVTLPAAAHCQPDVWAFQGWSETNVAEASSTCPALVDNNYEITKDVILYAIYKKADGGEKTIGYKISYQANNTTYYASSGVNQQKMSVSINANDAVVFGMTTTSGQSKLYQVDENGDAKANTYIYLDKDDKLDQGAEGSTKGYLWTISMTGTHSIISVKKNTRCIAGRTGDSGDNVVNASTSNVDAGAIVNGNITNYFHHITLVPVVKGAASYCTSPECVSLTWINGMSDANPVVTYPSTDGKIVLPTQTPTSCAPGLYSFVGWTTTEIPNYKTSQQEIVTAEMAAPEHATTYYAEFVNTAGNRYRTTCPETLYAITYKANGGEGEDYIQYSENKTNVTSYDGAAFSKTDCSLYQWNTAANGTGTAYKPNANIPSLNNIVGEGTTGTLYAQWTGDLSVTGNVNLTSGKDIAVYTTAAAGNLITISCPAIDMVHHIRYKFLDSENNQVSTLKLCNNGTENFNQLTNIATDGVVGAYEQTFSICYTPTEYNQKATYTLLLEGVNQGGTTVYNSCSLSVEVRSLPEQFVIAVKKDKQWYAVPNVLETTASAAPDALTIEVDDNNNPTYAWLSDNTTAALYMSASRYEANKHRGAIRFQSVENDKYITASYAKDATSFYMPTGNSDAQQFYLNSTDCNVYKITLDPAEFIDKDFESRWICMSGTKIGWYRYDNETKNVYFLPVKAITEEIEVNDGETVSLSKYEVDENTTIIVHAGGTLNADKVATIGNLTIERTGNKSGQVNETATLTANNAYFDLTLNAQGMKWYDIAVPFTVDRLHGLSFPNGGNFPLNDVLVYNGATRATNGTNGSAWQYQDDGDLVPGVGYDIMFASDVTTVRFTKKANAPLNNEVALAVSEFVSANPLDANWNYVANNTLHYVNLGFDDDENSKVVAQTYNPEVDSYTAYTQTEATYLVGTPFFVQVAKADNIVWNIDETHSVLRAPAMTMNRVERFTLEMSANGEMTDRLFVSADENARDEYQIGKDVAKMGVSSTIAQMWIDNYNTKLCANEAILYNGMATYQMGIFIPKEGEYTIAITNAPENATLYLTIDGLPIWNLSESAYVSTFTKGTHTEFGLLLQANTQSTPTNINSLNGNNKAQKIFKDQNIYILRDAKLYNAQGTELK